MGASAMLRHVMLQHRDYYMRCSIAQNPHPSNNENPPTHPMFPSPPMPHGQIAECMRWTVTSVPAHKRRTSLIASCA